MFCHSCGSKNSDGSRFCNMCGAPLAAVSKSLDQTQLGVGGSPELARAIDEARRSSVPDAAPSRASSPGSTGTEPTERVPSGFAKAPTPVSGWASTSQSMKAAEIPEGFDPSLSIQLDAIGIRSPRRMWGSVAAAAVVLVLLGGGTSYLMTREDPAEGHAQAGDPFEIGAPTAEVDFISGETDHGVAPAPVAEVDAGATPRGAPPTNLTTNGVVTPPPTRPTPLPSSPGQPQPTMRDPATSPLTPPPIAPTPIPTRPTTPLPVTPTPPPSVPTPPAETTAPTESDAEAYASRVRFLVRRYYAGRAQSCFQAATDRNETVSGQVVIGMHIGADGHVTSARVARNTTGDDALGTCLANQAQSWELAPPPGGSADLSFPFSR